MQKVLLIILSFCALGALSTKVLGQGVNNFKFKDIILQTDTVKYSFNKSNIQFLGEKYFYFKVYNNTEIAEITLIPEKAEEIEYINLLPSLDFSIIDSISYINDKYFRGKIQFSSLYNSKFPRFVFEVKTKGEKAFKEEIKLYPYFETSIESPSEEVFELYVGEDKTIELGAKNGYNIRSEEGWITTKNLEYKIIPTSNAVKFLVRPTETGYEEITFKPRTSKPFLNEFNQLAYELKPIILKFQVKPSRINYINFEKTEFFFDPQFNSNIEVQLDLNKNLALRRTYRIENQQEPGGRLVAELYTVSYVGNNNKILAWLRPYSLHRMSEGYLYLKEGDVTKFITNFDIIEKPQIDKLSLLRDGEDWTNNLSVYPGEKIEVRVEGTGLLKAEVQFDAVKNFTLDTTRRSDNVLYYFLKVPVDFSKRKVSVFMNKNITRYEFLVREHQVPKELDFVSLNYDNYFLPITSDKFNKPILYRETIEDVIISFDPKKIDQANKIYGKQFLNIEVKIFNSSKDLIEVQRLENLVICPGDNSHRYAFYDLKDCRKSNVNLNDYLLHKTYDLDGWSTLEIVIKHNDAKYGLPGYSRKIIIIKERLVLLDLQVSFPTGLLVKRFSSDSLSRGIGRFTGISTAFLTQLSFYDRHSIGKLKPYKVGVGLIALDIFNLNVKNNQRDLGIVVIGSLLPLRKNSRFTFPLYAGFGYLIQNRIWFMVFGPGIQFNF